MNSWKKYNDLFESGAWKLEQNTRDVELCQINALEEFKDHYEENCVSEGQLLFKIKCDLILMG